MSLTPAELQRVAERMLADYDARRPNAIFAERGTGWLTLADAYAIQRSVAALRAERGERRIGYKVGCVSPAIQQQFGLSQPVWGVLWESEWRVSGSKLDWHSFANLAIEGEIALCLGSDLAPGTLREGELRDHIAGWFPVIELHQYVFRGPRPTSQELVAGNAMHAGLVAPFPASRRRAIAGSPAWIERLERAEIRVDVGGEIIDTAMAASLPGGPLGSLRWLGATLAQAGEPLRGGDLVLTGSPGRLIPVPAGSAVTAGCEGIRVALRAV